MLFNSIHFVFFFLIVTPLYFLLPQKYRCFLLLAASCYFYMAFIPIYILILGFTIVVDYFAGIWLEKTKGKNKKWFLIASLIANIGVLAVFKYYDFLNENLSALLNTFGYHNHIPNLGLILPIGLSFHTFQAISYTVEVYRGRQKAERHFGIYALYVMYYPQLVAGPIERPQNLIHQLYTKYEFDYYRISEGLRLMLWGLVKKMVIADRLGIFVNEVYNNPASYQGFPLIWATYFFAIQIYCDFSGYSDIAIGASRIMGINLMQNFRTPYFSKNIQEFWSRWHISLSTWFRDYVFLPFAYSTSRKMPKEKYFGIRADILIYLAATVVTFFLCGLWHGANWTYVLWGLLHGFYIICGIIIARFIKQFGSNALKSGKNRIFNILSIFITFHIVLLAWVFFRANNVHDAFYILKNMMAVSTTSIIGVPTISSKFFMISLVLILLLFVSDYYKIFTKINSVRYINYVKVLFLITLIYLFGIFEVQQFIYFQF